ncbi:MAG TPA: rod shape-determining protein MreD [Thermoanaerobaculia bacterium]|nr:rod shape-determining protein MreD [Thermoanaerobaculia bacterium]
MRVLKLLAALLAALFAHLLLVTLLPPVARFIDPFLLAIAYTALPGRVGWAAVAGAILGLAHDGLSGGLYGLHGFAGTAVAFLMARTARLADLHKGYYIALFFACAVILQQLVLQGLLLLLVRRPELLSLPDLALRAAIAAPLGALLVAGGERIAEAFASFRRRRRTEVFLD